MQVYFVFSGSLQLGLGLGLQFALG